MAAKITNQERLKELLKKKNRIRYRIKKIEKKTDEELKAKDVKELQKYNRQLEKVKNQIAKLRAKIRRSQVTTAYQTVVRRSSITTIEKRDLLERNWRNTDWLSTHTHLTKMAQVQKWQADHPDGTKKECELDTHMSHHTIDKWWLG